TPVRLRPAPPAPRPAHRRRPRTERSGRTRRTRHPARATERGPTLGGNMDTMVLVHLVIAVVGVILMIVWAKINPVISLIVGSLYLGVAGGLAFAATVAAVHT